jgi:hypothetical protein
MHACKILNEIWLIDLLDFYNKESVHVVHISFQRKPGCGDWWLLAACC